MHQIYTTPEHKLIVFYIDLEKILDPRNIEYTDVLAAIASTLIETYSKAPRDASKLEIGYGQTLSEGLKRRYDEWGSQPISRS